jgi:hypothetical protein
MRKSLQVNQKSKRVDYLTIIFFFFFKKSVVTKSIKEEMGQKKKKNSLVLCILPKENDSCTIVVQGLIDMR